MSSSLELVAQLTDITLRPKISRRIAKMFGAETLLIFIKDDELNILLPAPGFIQTIPGRQSWQPFLDLCVSNKIHEGELRFPNKQTLKSAFAVACEDNLVFLLIGGIPDKQQVIDIQILLPMLSSVLKLEKQKTDYETRLKIAEQSLAANNEILDKLYATRLELQSSLALLQTETHARLITEKELITQQQKLNDLFRQAPAYIAVFHGPNHICTLANPLYKNLFGNRNLIGKTLREAVPEIRQSDLIEIMDEVYASGKPYIGNETAIELGRQGNSKIEKSYFNFVYQPIRNYEGAVSDIFVHAIEVTEQVNAKKGLARTKRMFDALFDSTVVAIALADLSGNILQANKTFLKLFGYTKAEFDRGLTSKLVTAPSSYKVTESVYDSLKRTRGAEPTAKKYIRKDGSEFPALVGAAMLPNSDNQFMAFILDTSEIEKLKELNLMKDEFIAIASHQLRTPATSVKQHIGIILEGIAGPVNDKLRDYLTTANNANNRQLNIIDDLLKIAQIDALGYRINFRPTNIIKTINQVVADYKPILDAKNQVFKLETKQSTVIASVDATDISICVANLVENASKYSADKTTITIKVNIIKDFFEIIISDQGVGISKDDEIKIFDKFTRIDNELSDTVSGNGLGLYLVKRIVDLHEGNIFIKSAANKGTSFIIQIPL